MSPADLERLRAVTAADVWKRRRRAARLRREGGAVEFAYLPEYVEAGGPAVASTLPVVPGVVRTSAGAVPPFFAGLLPEGRPPVPPVPLVEVRGAWNEQRSPSGWRRPASWTPSRSPAPRTRCRPPSSRGQSPVRTSDTCSSSTRASPAYAFFASRRRAVSRSRFLTASTSG